MVWPKDGRITKAQLRALYDVSPSHYLYMSEATLTTHSNFEIQGTLFPQIAKARQTNSQGFPEEVKIK